FGTKRSWVQIPPPRHFQRQSWQRGCRFDLPPINAGLRSPQPHPGSGPPDRPPQTLKYFAESPIRTRPQRRLTPRHVSNHPALADASLTPSASRQIHLLPWEKPFLSLSRQLLSLRPRFTPVG